MAAEKNDTNVLSGKTTNETASEAQQTWRSYLQLQDQLRSAMLALEQVRKDSDDAAQTNAAAIAAHLRLIEQNLATKERTLETMQNSNHTMLAMAGAFVGVGVVVLVFTVWLQMRAMNRLAEIASLVRTGHALMPASAGALEAGSAPLAGFSSDVSASTRLLGVVEQLEKRVHELEATAHLPAGTLAPQPSNDETKAVVHEPPASAPLTATVNGTHAEQRDRISMVLGKGQALLNLDQVEEAIACFNEVLAEDPHHAEALMKKGTALERQQKLEEALACYDHAIDANRSLTLAYLYKGGVCNQLERFDEALECYEQALRTQQRSASKMESKA